jgi:hypothetical protein
MLKRQRPPNVLEALGGYIALKMSLVELLSRPSYRHLKQQVSSRRGSLPLPAPAEQTQHAKPSGEKRESGWKRYSRRYCSGNQHLSRVRVSSQFLHQLLSWCDKGLAKIPANVCIQCDQTIPQK